MIQYNITNKRTRKGGQGEGEMEGGDNGEREEELNTRR
jgi:hypothetical protein